MRLNTLNDYINELERRGQLTRITAQVSPELEITEIADRIVKKHGSALLFEQVEGSEFPLLINAFGTEERMSLSLGADNLEQIASDIGCYLDLNHYTSVTGLILFFPKLLRLLCCLPWKKKLRLRRPSCQQIIDHDPDLTKLPVLKCWPLDGGRFFTLPLVITRDPGSRRQNTGMYRMQLLDKNTTAIHWHRHKDGARIYAENKIRGSRMPVAVAFGSSPAVTYSATAPLPPMLDEMMLAGFLQKRPVTLVKCVTCGLYVPEESQFVLEGYVDTAEPLVDEGPFGDHTGYYSLVDLYPRFHVTCMTRKRNAIYPTTIVGMPPMEDCYMAKATGQIFLPVLKLSIPLLINLHLPLEGVFHNCAIISVKTPYPGAARTVMNAMWGMGQMQYTKMIVAVDEATPPDNLEQVLGRILENVDPLKNLIFSEGPLDALDHSSSTPLYGTRLGIDASGLLKNQDRRSDPKYSIKVISVTKTEPFAGRNAAIKALEESPHKIIVVMDSSDPPSSSRIMWRLFNNIDASRDLIIKDGRIAVDATKKWQEEGLSRPWPDDIVMSPDIIELVNSRWTEYGFQKPLGKDNDIC